jgi:hypothetical protein
MPTQPNQPPSFPPLPPKPSAVKPAPIHTAPAQAAPLQPQMLPYSSVRPEASSSRAGTSSLAALVGFVVLLGCFYLAFLHFYDDQFGICFWLERVMLYFHWDTQPGTPGSGMNFISTLIPSGSILPFAYARQLGFSEETQYPSFAQFFFAAGFGIFCAAVLVDWRSAHVRWFAAAFPLAAGLWRLFAYIATEALTGPATAVPITAWGRAVVTPPGSGLSGIGISILIAALLGQAAVVYCTAWIGRPLSAWLAGALLPRRLSASLQDLWR